MKTLLLTNLYPSMQSPTRGMYNAHVFGALAARCEVRLVSPLPWWTRKRGQWLAIPRENHTGIEAVFHSYWTLPRIGAALHGRAMYASLRGLVRQIYRDFPFDAILASWAYPDAFAAAHIAREFGCPLVTNVLGSDINTLPHIPGLRPQIEWTLGQSSRVIAVSHALRERVLELGVAPERALVQHNGVDGAKFSPQDKRAARAKLGLPPDGLLVCYVGNLVPEKGVDTLVEAMAHLKQFFSAQPDGRPTIRLALVGSGSLETALRARVAHLGLQDTVQFHGRRLHPEIPDWMGACDVFCLPSRREGCPNVILEALSSGRPVVASRVGGVPELIHACNGLLVRDGDAPQLANALQCALQRDWNPQTLRNSVPCRSWEEAGAAYYAALEASIRESREAA